MRESAPLRHRRLELKTLIVLSGLLAPVCARSEPAPIALALPVSAACVSSPFGARAGGGPRASLFHTGIDLPAAAGTWVHAAAAGTVVAIRRRGSAGVEVEVRHSPTLTTRYDHLGSVAPALQSGKRLVAQGDLLGRIGRTGITYGTHLHFELLVNGDRVDAAPVLGLGRC